MPRALPGSRSSDVSGARRERNLFIWPGTDTHQMRLIGLLTEDPKTYFEVLEVLRDEGLRFVSLDFDDPVPANVGAIITTEAERDRIAFDRVVCCDDPGLAVARARRMANGEGETRELLIGVDPGSRPGYAALADGVVIERAVAPSPEAIGDVVDELTGAYPSASVIVRIGNGDRTNRNRIFNTLWDSGYDIEIVDERNTTRRSHTPDEDAAIEIAMTPGYRPVKRQEVQPCPGEIRNIQRISRLESMGRVTVSKELARKVALGELTMEDAIEIQEKGTTDRH